MLLEKKSVSSISRVTDFGFSGCWLREESVYVTQEGSNDYDYADLRIGEGTVVQNARNLGNILTTSGNTLFFIFKRR
jgi:hypothetical protein